MNNLSESIKNLAGAFREAALTPKHFDPTIKVDVKSHYGTDHVYIISDHAEAIAALTGKKTLTERNIEALKALGFSFYHKPERKMMASVNSEKEALPVKRMSRMIKESYDLCPHCASEIQEKGLYYNGSTWFHRACGNPIRFS